VNIICRSSLIDLLFLIALLCGAAQSAWDAGAAKGEGVLRALEVVERARARAADDGVGVRLDYVEMNDSGTFDVLENGARKADGDLAVHPIILSGAMWVGKTRLIDNILLGDIENVVHLQEDGASR
jgi:pantoate--beta-alanine ligase